MSAIYNNQKNKELSSASRKNIAHIQRDYPPMMGSLDVKVTIVEFFAPACGTSNASYPFVILEPTGRPRSGYEQIKRRYPKRRGSKAC
jgi:hypothetical protein